MRLSEVGDAAAGDADDVRPAGAAQKACGECGAVTGSACDRRFGRPCSGSVTSGPRESARGALCNEPGTWPEIHSASSRTSTRSTSSRRRLPRGGRGPRSRIERSGAATCCHCVAVAHEVSERSPTAPTA